jgi:hypothetical protein
MKETPMPITRFERLLPWCGLIAGILLVPAGLLASPPGIHATAQDQLSWYHAHQAITVAAGAAGAYFLVVMLMFGTALRQALRSGEPAESSYSTVAFAGAVVVALAICSDGMLTLVSAEAASNHQASTIITLAYVSDLSWIPWAAGSVLLFLGAGLGGLRTTALPRWLSIATIVLAAACLLGPAGALVFFVTPLWLAVTGLVLWRRLGPAERQQARKASRAGSQQASTVPDASTAS